MRGAGRDRALKSVDMYVECTYSLDARGGLQMASEAHDLKKRARLDIRVTPRQKAELEAAAQVRSKPLSSFVIEAAEAEAQRVLSERTIFIVDADRWSLFSEALDRPAMDKPRLRALMSGPSIFKEA